MWLKQLIIVVTLELILIIIIVNEIRVFDISTSKRVDSETTSYEGCLRLLRWHFQVPSYQHKQKPIVQRLLLMNNKRIAIMDDLILFSISNVWKICNNILTSIIMIITTVNGIFSKFKFRLLTFIIMINLLLIQLLIMVLNEFILIVIVVNEICPQFWLSPSIVLMLELIIAVTVTVVNGIFLQLWLDVIIIIVRTVLLFVIYFMHQVSNYLFDMNIQTVVYINIFLKIDILPTHFIAMHASLSAVLILILIFHIGIYSDEVIDELHFNILLLQQLII